MVVTDPAGGLTARPGGILPAPWRAAGRAPAHAPGSVEAWPRTDGNSGAVSARLLADPASDGAEALPPRGPEGSATGWSNRRTSGFLAQLIGQDAEPEEARPSLSRRVGVGAYEKAARFVRSAAADREGLVVVPPLSSGRAVDLSI